MSLSQSLEVPLRWYNTEADRLFLVYYALPPGFNANKWGVSPTSIDTNIHTAINKPVVVYRKSTANPFHTHQAGNFVHPTAEEAAAEIGHLPTAQEYYKWQEKFAIGRVRSVDKRERGYAFTLEITDPEAKNILKSPAYSSGIPGWTSPQIMSNARMYPDEERKGLFNHWQISHVALVDAPAYGKEQAGLRAQCLGAEKDCMITTRSASDSNLGFCIKQAAIDLITAFDSSHVESQGVNSHTTMSQSENTSPTTPSETLTYTNTDNQQTPQKIVEPAKEQPAQQVANNEEQPKEQELQAVKTLEEANVQIKQMSELLKEQTKQLKLQGKELEAIKLERKQARLSFIIPRELFKSDESHQKEVQKFMNENISEQWLAEYWKTKKDLAMATSAKRIEEPIQVKSASTTTNGHDVPDFSSSQNTAGTSNLQKQLELQKMILEGGAG